MPVSPSASRSSPFVPVADSTAPVPTEPPGFIAPPAPGATVRPVLRVGDYEVGETFCPRLYGHPGIRY